MARRNESSEGTEAEVAATEAPAPRTKKDPVPEGFVTPVQFAKQLGERLGREVRPQIIYGYVRNSKDFPSQQNTDGHFIVPLEAANSWFDAKEARRAEKAAAKEAKDAETAA